MKEERPAEQINLLIKPKHTAIIMDGNGRWAKERGLERSEGHRKGLDVVHEITDAAAEVGCNTLLYMLFRRKIGIVRKRKSMLLWLWSFLA